MNEKVFTTVLRSFNGSSVGAKQQTSQPHFAEVTSLGFSEIRPVSSHESQLSAKKAGNQGCQDGMYQGGGEMARFITPGGNALDTSQPGFPVVHRNAVIDGISCLAALRFVGTAFLLNLYTAQARGVTKPHLVLGIVLGLGGLGQNLAGILEWASGNTYGAVLFNSYGAFWLSFSTFYIPQFGVVAAYAENPAMLENALGLYLCVWGVVTILFIIASQKSSVALLCTLAVLTVDLFTLAAGHFIQGQKCFIAGGVMGIIVAILGAYIGLAGLLTDDFSPFRIPVGDLTPKDN
ncbi:membrane protein [Cryptococcus bacillisporus CA1873]|uniref:Membrane protein n=1 Tax=Cryptococcus bacillisporus CA1873 TaxID=1296111 RepID=A0ABR5B2M5_CRYGA|nr:membrane protein [Cryptococcus bacillisporus CA1873]|eukprot:KIR57846.1 membrane protein [Cryptococcus gattii CA1873]